MKKLLSCITALVLLSCTANHTDSWIRINQVGYLPNSVKVAVFCSKGNVVVNQFALIDAESGNKVWKSDQPDFTGVYGPFASTYRLNFSEFKQTGIFYLKCNSTRSPDFRIDPTVYDGSADFLLKYMRQQRCGFNPFLKDSCHTHDGFTIYGPMPDGTYIDVTGGWHDAADYLQYVATSANATFNMLLAYRDYPGSFGDHYQANGLPGQNQFADVLDEARWGLDWLLKMHPRPDWMLNQIADDRDHAGFRLPNRDSVNYGKGFERPVYFCSGEVQGLFNHKNRTTGTASTAGKFASAFAIGSEVYSKTESEFAKVLNSKAKSAYIFGQKKPGACQTAPGKAPYFYEEDNWSDDMELGAASLLRITGNKTYLSDALEYAEKEPVTPWMGADTARHYQWYPFLNIGHYELAAQTTGDTHEQIIEYMKQGIDNVYNNGKHNAFLIGVPFIWCSNNLTTAFVTQCGLYRQLTDDQQYLELEAAMRDWLFGCNPWGTSMVIGLPDNGIYPKDPHSSLAVLKGYKIDGGLVDGPVYGSIFNNLQYISLIHEDEFATFQSELTVYHDDYGDYSTNEPTMDGTATLIYYLAAMQFEGAMQKFTQSYGGIIRGDTTKKSLALVFTGGDFADGGQVIRDVLKKHRIRGSFFFTGDFCRNPEFMDLIKDLKNDGHYLGPHSDKHLLYCSWEKRDSLLVTKQEFIADLDRNFEELKKFGIKSTDVRYFIPPYEWYNDSISDWSKSIGMNLINYTPGTLSAADYTIPDMGQRYRSSEEIFDSILSFEKESKNGLNGFILLSHIGTHPDRTDKFYYFLDKLISALEKNGYRFFRIDDLLK
jgi:endoglucanase